MSQSFHKLIHFSKTPTPEVVKLLSDTIIGTNGLQYKLLDTPEKVFELHQPLFVFLQRRKNVLGNITFCKREIDPVIKHYYIRYFAFAKGLQAAGKQRRGNSILATIFNDLLLTDNLSIDAPTYGQSVYWAYIDPQNSRSFNNHFKYNFIKIGTFKTIAFSRFYPKKSIAVSQITESEKTQVTQLLSDFYEGYNFYSSTHLFDKEQYYVYKVNDVIVAGVQIHKVHWQINSLPGRFGPFMLKTSPYIPLVNKLINPNDYRFLATEGLFWQAGYENILADFFEGILHLTNYNSMLFWEDTKANRLSKIRMNWGWLRKLTKQDSSIEVLAKFNGVPDEQINHYKMKPTYISGFDVT